MNDLIAPGTSPANTSDTSNNSEINSADNSALPESECRRKGVNAFISGMPSEIPINNTNTNSNTTTNTTNNIPTVTDHLQCDIVRSLWLIRCLDEKYQLGLKRLHELLARLLVDGDETGGKSGVGGVEGKTREELGRSEELEGSETIKRSKKLGNRQNNSKISESSESSGNLKNSTKPSNLCHNSNTTNNFDRISTIKELLRHNDTSRGLLELLGTEISPEVQRMSVCEIRQAISKQTQKLKLLRQTAVKKAEYLQNLVRYEKVQIENTLKNVGANLKYLDKQINFVDSENSENSEKRVKIDTKENKLFVRIKCRNSNNSALKVKLPKLLNDTNDEKSDDSDEIAEPESENFSTEEISTANTTPIAASPVEITENTGNFSEFPLTPGETTEFESEKHKKKSKHVRFALESGSESPKLPKTESIEPVKRLTRSQKLQLSNNDSDIVSEIPEKIPEVKTESMPANNGNSRLLRSQRNKRKKSDGEDNKSEFIALSYYGGNGKSQKDLAIVRINDQHYSDLSLHVLPSPPPESEAEAEVEAESETIPTKAETMPKRRSSRINKFNTNTDKITETELSQPQKRIKRSNPKYCYCRKSLKDDMIACDNPDCPIEWFHITCVLGENYSAYEYKRLMRPKVKWFCKPCRKNLSTRQLRH